jgi:UDP-N-acetylmuramate: L-alanyl-gamma-D-glutamyl-meso-diaminopimelate ligase
MHIYFMGICGTAMGNAALLMRALGHEVSGSDKGIYPPMSDMLLNSGVKIYDGYSAERLSFINPDLVVVGNVVSRGHPEMEWLLESRALDYVSLPELLRTQLLKNRHNIVVSGTHGKTTTSSIAAFLLREHGENPGWLIGGIPRDLPSGSAPGADGGAFVIEGDEYDTAFFDKRSKFIQYLPEILLLNNLEFDHADIFRDLQDVQRTFSHVIRLVPRNGYIVANGDDENIAPLLENVSWAPILRVGTGENCDIRIVNFRETPEGSEFDLTWRGNSWGHVAWAQSGIFNARNAAMAATACALYTATDKPEWSFPIDVLAKFQGVKRRREILVDTPSLVAIEDFGHHPTALKLTLQALRERYPNHKLIAAFEPRSNTAVRKLLQDAFTDALTNADAALIAPVHHASGGAEKMNPTDVAEMLRSRGVDARSPETTEQLLLELEELVERASPDAPALVVFFSNGAFGGIIKRFADLYRPLI